MNARANASRFTRRAKSASPPPSPKTYRVFRTTSKLKSANDGKGPSPTSVMANHFDFDDEPFDCGQPKRAASVGNLSRLNGRDMNSSERSPTKLNVDTTGIGYQYPQQQPLRMAQTSGAPPKAPKSPYRQQKPDIPKSPMSASNKASSFRQRRLLLAQQRKWKEEAMDKSIQSRNKGDRIHSEQRNTISGKEKIMDGIDGLEISISGHLEKEGYDHTLLPPGMSSHGELSRNDKNLPIQSALPPPQDDGSSYGYGDAAHNDHELDAMTIDTVSSLNTMQSEMSRKSTFSHGGLRSPRRSPRARKKLLNVTQSTYGQNDSFGLEDTVHPPMYVQSNVLKKTALKADTSTNVSTYSISSHASKKEESRQFDEPSFDEGPDMDELKKIEAAPKLSELEVTNVISNEKSSIPRPRKSTGSVNGYEKENDIPTIDSCAPKYERNSPIPQILTVSQDEMASVTSEMSGTMLRRRRLQKQNRYLTHKKAQQEKLVSRVPTPNPGESLDRGDSPDFHETTIDISKSKQVVDISFGSLKMSPFDESNEKPEESFDEDKLDSDLHTLADKRHGEEDERSIITTKSYQTLQTYATLKTCFTCKPANDQEMEAAIKVKQDRLQKIHHALTCTHPHPTRADDDQYKPCPEMKSCHALCILVQHVQTCTSVECEVPGCGPYKKIWNHYRRCILRTFTKAQKKKCQICGDVWRNYAQDLEYSFDQSIEDATAVDSSFQTLRSNEVEI